VQVGFEATRPSWRIAVLRVMARETRTSAKSGVIPTWLSLVVEKRHDEPTYASTGKILGVCQTIPPCLALRSQ
jgi:hypothetical protein